MSNIWDSNLEIEDDEFNEEKELAKIKETIIKPGEIYQLGMHRLICADGKDPEAIKKLVGTEKIDLIDVDPPYNIGLNYSSGIGTKNKYGGKTEDNKSDEDYRLFLNGLIKNSLSVSKKNAHVFFWCDQKYIGLLQSLYKELKIDSKRVCLWIKNNQNPTPQLAFNKAYEPCVYGTIGKPFMSDNVKNLNEVLNKEIGTGSRLIDDIMDLFDIWLVKRLPAAEYEHPTQKPPTLHEKVLRRCTRPGDNVLDLCAGSGSLMVACEQLKRRAFLSEIDPIFATLIIKRYEKLTNKKAKKLS
jgi:DNA modification methylase